MHKYITEEQYKIGESNGISRKVVYNRVNYQNWTVDEAITRKIYGGLWKQYKQLAESNGISRTAFRHRINKGVEPYEAATIPLMGCRERKIPLEMKELAKTNGIKMSTFHYRVFARKWTPYEAATIPVGVTRGKGINERRKNI